MFYQDKQQLMEQSTKKENIRNNILCCIEIYCFHDNVANEPVVRQKAGSDQSCATQD